MAERFGAGNDGLPGLSYQPNNGMPGGIMQRTNEVPCNTTVYTGQPGANYPDPNGSDPVARVQEFWPGGQRMGR
jgi:hypothetical protein